MSLEDRILQTLIALDQLCNALFLGGYADETISARAWRSRSEARWRWLQRALDWLHKDHCYDAYESEVQRRQEPPEYRQIATKTY